MSDLNTVTLTGRLGRDLELRKTKSDHDVAESNLAVGHGYGDNERTLWIGLVFWGKAAISASEHLGKGRKIAITGRLDQDEWEDKDTGKKQRKTRVVVERWTFADGSKPPARQSAEPSDEPPSTGAAAEDDDIPF